MENTYREGHFVWRELMTADALKARGFYGELFGWSFKDMPIPGEGGGGNYVIIHKGETQVGGMMQIPPGAPYPPMWMSYVSVKDVDVAVEKTLKLGGQKLMVESIPTVGRIGVIMDPQGAVLGLMRGETGDGPAPGMPGAGTFCWESLNTSDQGAAKAFYTEVVGWTVGKGPGDVGVFGVGTSQVADIGSAPPGVHAHWLLHVVVEKLEAARDRAEKLGGKVLMGEIPIPGIGRMAVIADPLGAALSLFEAQMPAA